jgi:hypothetical protein
LKLHSKVVFKSFIFKILFWSRSGVDVTIKIFCEFWWKIGVFLKNQFKIKFLQKLAQVYAKFFGENIFKNRNIGRDQEVEVTVGCES